MFKWMHRFLKAASGTQRARRPAPCRLRVEALEDRTVPSATGILEAPALAAAVTSAQGQGNPHFQGDVTCDATLDGTTLTLTASGTVVGIGSTPVTVTLNANVTITFEVINPGGHAPPGLNRNTTAVSTSQQLVDTDHNGRETFTLTSTTDLSTLTGGKKPNDKFQINITQVDATDVTVTLSRGSTVLATATCDSHTFTP